MRLRFMTLKCNTVGLGALALVGAVGACSGDPSESGGGTSGNAGSVGGASAVTTGDSGTTAPGTTSTNGATGNATVGGTSTTTSGSVTGAGGGASTGGLVSSVGGMSTSGDAMSSVGGGMQTTSTTDTTAGGATSSTDDSGAVSTTEATGGSGGTGTALDELCPPGIGQTITVGSSGADFSSVQAAVDSLSGNSTPTRIDIQPGTYTEKLTISGPSNLCLVGEDPNTTILTYNDANATIGSTSGSASVHVSADDFSAANITFQNSYGSGSQAVALRATGDRQQYYNCRFVAYQDTLYTHEGSQYFRDCYVQGNVDYVFGHATAVLENCEARNVEGGSAVSAPNTELSQAFGIVFLGGRFTAESSVSQGSVALGRPWGADGAAAYLNVELGAHINPVGFVEMSGNSPQNARFREYQSTGPGAAASQHASYQMSDSEAAGYTLSQIFPGWVPSYSQ